MKTIDVVYAALPFAIGLFFKCVSYFAVPPAQEKALRELVNEANVSGKAILNDGQQKVIAKWMGFAGLSITAPATLASSCLAQLISALRYQRKEIWCIFWLGVAVSLIAVILIYRCRGSWEKIGALTAGGFFFGMSVLMDFVGMVGAIVAAMSPK